MGNDGNRKRLVLKVGTSTLTKSDNSIDMAYLESLCEQVAKLEESGWDVAIVSSGAIGAGLERLGIPSRPSDMPTLQAAASVGQAALAAAYDDTFARHSITSSLVLLTRRDTADRGAYLNARSTMFRLFDLGVVPIVNENDTISVEQIRFGDNDSLAALVACLVDADMLVILSDIDGLYDGNPAKVSDARLVHRVERIDAEIMSWAGGVGSANGSGGMYTKIGAARIMMAAGIPMAIANGRRPCAILECVQGECPGTLFQSASAGHTITPKKLWIALGDNSKGRLVVDDGAAAALLRKGGSLLSVGIKGSDGDFEEGDVVDIAREDGFVIGRGLAGAGSDEISLAAGKSSGELSQNRLLAYLSTKPVIHRDDMLLF